MAKVVFKVGDTVQVVNTKELEGNDNAPPVVMDAKYPVEGITIDSAGNQHLDLGLKSTLNYVRSWETKEELPHGNKIHWVHPSRVILVSTATDILKTTATTD